MSSALSVEFRFPDNETVAVVPAIVTAYPTPPIVVPETASLKETSVSSIDKKLLSLTLVTVISKFEID